MKKFDWEEFLFGDIDFKKLDPRRINWARYSKKARKIWEKIDPRNVDWKAFDPRNWDLKRYTNGVNGINAMMRSDKGMALLTVIIIIAVLAMIVSTLADVSVFSFQRKAVDYHSKGTFYDAETCLDDIQMGLQTVPVEFFDIAEDTDLFLTKVMSKLGTKDQVAQAMKSYITLSEGECDVTVGSISKDLTRGVVIIKDVHVGYTNEDGYYSEVATDIVIQPPKITLDSPIGSYSTVAGAGLNISIDNDGVNMVKAGSTVNYIGSIYVGYKEDVQDVSGYNFNTDWQKWDSVKIGNGRNVIFSGDSVTLNGNLYISAASTVHIQGNKADIYGGVILEKGATLIIDEDTQLTCHGIYVTDGTNVTPYTGNTADALGTISQGGNYYGHIPYTYPFAYEPNAAYANSQGINTAYPNLDPKVTVNYYANYAPYSGDKGSLAFWKRNTNGSNTLYNWYLTGSEANYQGSTVPYASMTTYFADAQVLVGKAADKNGKYTQYKYWDKFVNGSGKTADTYYSTSYPLGKTTSGGAVAESTLRADKPCDYSGIAYPVTISGTTATINMYGVNNATTITPKNASNIVIDATKAPVTKTVSKYNELVSDQVAQNPFAKDIYDDVLYQYLEIEDTAFFQQQINSGQTQGSPYVVDGKNITFDCKFDNIQTIQGTQNDIRLMITMGRDASGKRYEVDMQPGGYFRCLLFTNGLVKARLQGQPVIYGSIITETEMDQIDAYKKSKDESSKGYSLMSQYDAYGAAELANNMSTASYGGKNMNAFLTSDYRLTQNVEGSATGGTYVNYYPKTTTYTSTDNHVEVAFGSNFKNSDYSLTINDFFRGGIESLYSKNGENSTGNTSGNINYTVVQLENWTRW